ncbi:MAG: N-(5'-phosphoribosyl)anthranilate isomerase [Cytophagaceae bacterium]|nr:N-(5'-phosphoribosyl)anthranilate isomerase [Cytophagaceae bacterium]
MSLRTLVKVSEVNNLSDARYCAGMGVEMIGFSLDENHPKFIELSKLREIAVWISGIKVVGEFTGENIDNINYLAEQLNLDYIQINHAIPNNLLHSLKKPVILKLIFEEHTSVELEKIFKAYKNNVAYYLIESETCDSISGIEDMLENWTVSYPILIGFGITNDSLEKITNEIKPKGIALKGGNEIKPGLKSFDELSSILEVLEVND